MTINFQEWTRVTGSLSWENQRSILESLKLAKAGKVRLIYASNDFKGFSYLFNRINYQLYQYGISTNDQYVTPLAAEMLIINFGDLKEQPLASMVDEAMQVEAFALNVYHERSDDDLARDWVLANSTILDDDSHDNWNEEEDD